MSAVASRNGFNAPVLFDDAQALDTPNTFPTACTGGETDPGCILGFKTVDDLKVWIEANQGRAGTAVVFGDTFESTDPEGNEVIKQARAALQHQPEAN